MKAIEELRQIGFSIWLKGGKIRYKQQVDSVDLGGVFCTSPRKKMLDTLDIKILLVKLSQLCNFTQRYAYNVFQN